MKINIGEMALCGLFLVSPFISVKGQDHVVSDSVSLNEVVVSANRHVTLRKEASSLVKVIDRKLFENIQAGSLSDGLDYEPGVRVGIGCRNCGKMEARINGLDGNYSQILVDSRPLFSSVNGMYALEQIPTSMIERVEVVRGGSSALFGSSAIGGVINIITRTPDKNMAEFSHTLMSIGSGNRFDNNTSLNASLVAKDGNSGLGFYAQNRERPGYDRDGDGYTELTRLRTQTVGFRGFLKTDDRSKLNMHFYHIGDFRRGGNLLDQPPHLANIAEQTEHDIYGGTTDYDWHSKDLLNHLTFSSAFQSMLRKSYFGGILGGSQEEITDAATAYGKTNDRTLQLEAQYCHQFEHLLFLPATTTFGLVYEYSQLKDESLWYQTIFEQKVRTGSIYFQNEWKNHWVTVLLGGRLDKNNLLDHVIFSPRFNVRVMPDDYWTFRMSYADGFRNPQYFDDDLHEMLIGGNRVKTRLNNNLKEERSHSWSLSADYNNVFFGMPVDFLVEGFYTHLSNAFVENYVQEADGTMALLRTNGSGANVYGMNLEANIKPLHWMNIQAGMTCQQALYEKAHQWSDNVEAEKRMLHTPYMYGYFTFNMSPFTRWMFVVDGKQTGSMRMAHSQSSGTDKDITVTTPSFFELGAKISYTMPIRKDIKLQLSTGVRNLFDQFQSDLDTGYNRDSEYTYGPELPRCFYISAKVSL